MMREEQEKLQEAASATIGSMSSLLEEKNRELERFVALFSGIHRVLIHLSGFEAFGLYMCIAISD